MLPFVDPTVHSGFVNRWRMLFGCLWLLWFVAGCQIGTDSRAKTATQAFHFPADTLAVTNETAWSYTLDPITGQQHHTPRIPAPDYSLHCFVLARTAKQFHAHAQFQPAEPPVDETVYRGLLRSLLRRSPRTRSLPKARIVFPGFSNLNEFSAAYPNLIRAEAGGAWYSYFQRGNWRMVLPFTKAGQAVEARRLADAVHAGTAPVVHVSEFPHLGINHGMLLYDVTQNSNSKGWGTEYCFRAYDPNDPNQPVTITFDPSAGGFKIPPLPYYHGGTVKLYEVYCSVLR